MLSPPPGGRWPRQRQRPQCSSSWMCQLVVGDCTIWCRVTPCHGNDWGFREPNPQHPRRTRHRFSSLKPGLGVVKRDEPQHLADRDCVPSQQAPSCGLHPIGLGGGGVSIRISLPTITMVPTTSLTEYDSISLTPRYSTLFQTEKMPGGALVSDDYVPVGVLKSESTVPGEQISPSTQTVHVLPTTGCRRLTDGVGRGDGI